MAAALPSFIASTSWSRPSFSVELFFDMDSELEAMRSGSTDEDVSRTSPCRSRSWRRRSCSSEILLGAVMMIEPLYVTLTLVWDRVCVRRN